MKNFTVITEQIELINQNIRISEAEHSNLDQISMLSSEGNKLRERINKLKGMKTALGWVIKDQINGNLYDLE